MSQQPTSPENAGRFESDTQKIVHRHLQNQNDTITEDDIRGVRIGMTPQVQATASNLNAEPSDGNRAKELTNDDIELANEI